MSNQEEGGAPAASSSTGTGEQGATAQPMTTEQLAELERLAQRAAYQRQREQLRADTPPGRVNVRVERGATPLGLVVFDRWNGLVLRTSRMEDWRTEALQLRAGEAAYVVPLVGDDLVEFERATAEVRERAQATQGEA